MSLLSTVFFVDDYIKYLLVCKFPCKELTEINDIVYDTEHPDTGKLDIIYDEKLKGKFSEGKYPVFFMIHGGGWIEGDKKMRRGYCQHMARRGAITINISYGLGPKHLFPEYMKQIYKALQWCVENADEYNMDLSKFVISGDSAGGHLSMVTMNCQNHPEYREHLGLPTIDEIKIKGAILNCPAIDFEGKIINLPILRTMTYHCTGIKHYKKLKDNYEFYEELQVCRGVTKDFPKVFLNNGLQDIFTNGGSMKLKKKFNELGVDYVYYLGWEPLNSFHDYNLKTWMPQARHCIKKEKEFMEKIFQEN